MKLRSLAEEIEILQKWDDAYYNGTPLVTDQVYDAERDRVLTRIRLEAPNHAYLQSVGAPTQDGSVWPKFKHTTTMGSLFKVNSEEEFYKWIKAKGTDFILTEKADGCTIAAYYDNGILTNLTTRGDGDIGEDITGNAKYFQNVKFNLPGFTGIIRGEAIILLDTFQKYFAPLGMANPRNAASGKVRDTQNSHLKRHITIQWFDVISDIDFPSWEKKFKYLQSLGLQTLPYYASVDPSKIWSIYQDYIKTKRGALNYWIDGLVARINNTHQHDSLGIVDKRPKGSIAIKFPANGVQTKLVDFEINRGLAGRLTPVGIIEPVLIDGTTVSRINLHGPDWIAAMSIAIGDTVEVAKAGDIIPQITQKIAEATKNRKPITFPSHCPLCQAKLVRNGAYIECQNKTCIGETYGAIAKWLQKLDVKGIGDSILQELIKEVKEIDQLYTADVAVFNRAAGGSSKIGKKIWKELHSKKEIPLAVFLSGLHVSSLGSTNGQRLASHFKTLDAVLSASEEDIRKISGIAENASKIIEGIQRKKPLIQRLRKLLDIQNIQQGEFTGLSFCITGKLSKPRNEIEDWIKSLGGVVKGVDKGLSYLVTDDPSSGSAKNQKADKYGVKKITEQDLYDLVKQSSAVSSSDEPLQKIVVKLGHKTSLFESIVSNNVGWIELQKVAPKKYKIVNASFRDADQRLGYVHWDDEVEDLDDGSTLQSRRKGISSHLEWNGIKLMEDSITAPAIQDIEKAFNHINMTSWEENEL